jgi:simple sugar transport system substrate-binding protein/ribose transport system substrate-binding protein
MCPGKQVVIFSSTPDVEICRENIQGFRAAADSGSLKLIHVYDNYDDPVLARSAVDRLATEYPDVNGIYICSANSSAACRRIEELDMVGRYAIVASDLFDDLNANMDKGIINATLFQNPQKQGHLCIKYLYEMICGERVPGEEIQLVPQIILRSNRDDLMRNMEEMEKQRKKRNRPVIGEDEE